MEPVFDEERANDLVREHNNLVQQISQLEKRLDRYNNVLRAMFELMQDELDIEPASLTEKLAAVVRERAARAQAPCRDCGRPLGGKMKCMYCGTERKVESIFDRL